VDLDPTQLTAAVLRLPPAERARLAEVLLSSLEGEDASWEAAWLAEAERRDQAADADPTRVRPAADVIAAVRAELEAAARSER
jgi:putative addiction module component (TIGR02574 family)